MSRDREETEAFLAPESSDASRKWWAGKNLKQALSILFRRLLNRKTRVAAPRRFYKVIIYLTVTLLIFLIAHALLAPSYTSPPNNYLDLSARCHAGHGIRSTDSTKGCANPSNEKVFLAVSLYDSTGDLAGGLWGEILLDLINLLGPSNVFLSIYENDSGSQGAAGLEKLRNSLPCRHRLVSDGEVKLDGFSTVGMPDNSTRVKRTVYLSEMRNRALRPLDRGDAEELGVSRFDKILFLNDVLFEPIDAAHLLFNTNRGPEQQTHYLVACALDYYYDPFMMYDTYALRDAEGFHVGEQIFPFFSTAGQGLSRRAVLRQSDAVPVKSCWGGLVAMNARYIQTEGMSHLHTDQDNVQDYTIDPDAPRKVTTPVRFRGEREVFLDACECCLFIADVTQAAASVGDSELGVYLNPYVRVAYSPSVLRFLPYAKRWERLLVWPQWILTKLKHKPTPNPYRTVEQGQPFLEEVWRQPENSNGGWELAQRIGRSGMFCDIRNMQIIKPRLHDGDPNWENTLIPDGQQFEFAGI